VPYKFRLRRSSTQMLDDPFTLLVTLNNKVIFILSIIFKMESRIIK